jgi:hypothetical protein
VDVASVDEAQTWSGPTQVDPKLPFRFCQRHRRRKACFGVGPGAAGANLPTLSARPATNGGEGLIVAPISRFRIDPGRDAPRMVVSPAMLHHASLVLRRGRHAIPVLADLLIAGASGRVQIIVPRHGRPDVDIGLGAESPSQQQHRGKNCAFHCSLPSNEQDRACLGQERLPAGSSTLDYKLEGLLRRDGSFRA